jgi:hypothetical protein
MARKVGDTPSELRKERGIEPGDLVKWHPCAEDVLGYKAGAVIGIVLRYIGRRDAVEILDRGGGIDTYLLKFVEKNS